MSDGLEAPGGVQHPDNLGSILDQIAAGSTEKWNSLPASGRDWIIRFVLEPAWKEGGADKNAMEALYAADYEMIPPTPEEYLDSTDYAKDATRELFPNWRPVILKACDPTGGVYEMNITGATSLGKTTAAVLVYGYKLTRIFTLRNAPRFYGLQTGTKIFFGLYATTQRMVKDVGFTMLKDVLIKTMPFFRDRYPPLPHGREYVRWENKPIEIITGSSELHAIGRSLFAVIADELNWYARGERTSSHAHELVSEVSRRLEGRFVQEGGDIPGIAIYISQTRTKGDYLELRFKEKKATPGVLCVRGPRWAFNTLGYHRDRNRGFREAEGDAYFRTFVGTEVSDPRILDRVTRRQDGSWLVEPLKAEDDASIPLQHIQRVPVLHYKAYCDDLPGALRNLGDIPSGAFTPWFSRRDVLEQAFRTDIIFPFPSQTLPCYERSEIRLQDTYAAKRLTRIHMGKPQPIRHPEAPRFVHLDVAKGASAQADRLGLAMVHPAGHYLQERKWDELMPDDLKGIQSPDAVKLVEADFYVGLEGGPYGEAIDFRKIRVFLSWLRDIGYWIKCVTADLQMLSFDMLQRLREMGFLAENLSVDKTSAPYRTLRGAFNENRLALAWPPTIYGAEILRHQGDVRQAREAALEKVILYTELTGLEHDVDADKIDHRETNPDGTKGSKDIADALCGATFRCLTDEVNPGDAPIRPTSRTSVKQQYNRYLGGRK